MRIVVFSNADSIWCKEYIENVLIGKYDVLLISGLNKKYRRFYRENRVKVMHMDFSSNDVVSISRRIASQIRHDDIFHVHYVNFRILKYVFISWMKCKKRILTYWGSDILRASSRQVYATFPFIYTADVITVIDNNMYDKLKPYVLKCRRKHIKCLSMGVSTLNDIEKIEKQMSIGECKSYFELPSDKIIVLVGYNARREQQHMEMMREAVKLPREILSKILFLFHFGYGYKDNEYIMKLEKFLKKNNVQYRVIGRFLDKKEISIMRKSTDILLYGQTTDAFSASVMECLYAGAVLIKPKWLDYSEYDGLVYYEYGEFSEIPEILAKVVEEGARRMDCNKKLLKEKTSWDVFRDEWNELYKY